LTGSAVVTAVLWTHAIAAAGLLALAARLALGVFKSAQNVNASGGRMLVDSTPGERTRVRLLPPTPARAQSLGSALQDVA
jgi:hypothetical protein